MVSPQNNQPSLPHPSDTDGSDEAIRHMASCATTPGVVTTWLNHWSLLHADWQALRCMDVIGVDGTLLQLALRHHGIVVGRTSADLVLPDMLDLIGEDQPIAIIGAAPGVAQRAAERLAPRPVFTADGYEELRALREDMTPLRQAAPRLVIVGLGAGLQERVAREIAHALPEASVCTAGGWIDQFAAKEQYFPPIVHRLRLGWAWRVAHEPRRLGERYTVDAWRFLRIARPLILRLTTFARPTSFAFLVRTFLADNDPHGFQ